jgi:DNA-binding response OmpR family regulator
VGSRLLLVEDDETIGRSLEQSLRAQGYEVSLAVDAEMARHAFTDGVPDLLVLDLGLPDAEGLDLCREFRAVAPELSIVVLTARDEEIDVVLGLDAGADDYVTKPFRLAEFLARVRAHLRRPESTGSQSQFVVGDLIVDVAARRVWAGDAELALRPREFDVLALLAGEAGRSVTRERIMDECWDAHWHGSTKTLDVHISQLRSKLARGAGPERPTIAGLRRVGYRLDAP